MADSIDRVFVHALHTVKKISRTGTERPPSANRMRLYGLYKQAMEGDVDGVMERPDALYSGLSGDALRNEQDKWDAWNAQRGISRTEAKRSYIETLIETMHTYTKTPATAELVAELEFVWNQIKDNSPQSPQSVSSSLSKKRGGAVADDGAADEETYYDARGRLLPSYGHGHRHRVYDAAQRRPSLGAPASDGGPMKMLTPMSEEDEAEREARIRLIEEELEAADSDGSGRDLGGNGLSPAAQRWSKMMQRAMVKLSAEIAALREQITAGREFRARRERTVTAWVRWLAWRMVQHAALDAVVLALVLLWMRRRKDRRLEDHVRGALRLVREYVNKMLPSR